MRRQKEDMVYKVGFYGIALEEYFGVIEYLSQFYAGTVRKFFDEFEKCRLILAENPYTYQVYESVPAYRRAIVGDYLVFYKVFDPADNQQGVVEIHRILRGTCDIKRYIDSEDTQ